MKSTVRLSRRTVLRGSLGGASIAFALPPLDLMFNTNGTALAAGQAFPVRFGVWFWGNGVRLSKWNPTATGANYALSETLMPFANVKAKMSILSGLNMKTADLRAHHSGQAGIMTGEAPLPQQAQGGAPFASTFRSASIDQVVAKLIGGTTKFRSLQVGVSRQANKGEGTNLAHISHNGPDSPNPSEFDPQQVFNRVFKDPLVATTPGMPQPVDATLALRKSVLDAVLQDMNALKGRVGDADRKKLDQHADNVRAIEKRLAAAADTGGGGVSPFCKKPAAPISNGSMSAANKNMADLMTMALACDLTRVFTFQFSAGVDSTTYSEAGVNGTHHELTHNEGGDQPNVQKVCVFIMKQFAYFAEQLAGVQEGATSLLDNCSVLGTSDCAQGLQHSRSDYPIVVMGGGGGKLKTGIHYRSSGDNTTQAVLSLARATGATVPKLGAVTAGLPAIEA